MFKNLHIFMGLSSNAKYTFPRSRLVFLVLVLVLSLSLSGAGQITPVHAAPPAQEPTYTNMRWYLNISNPGTLCAGRDYPIRVTPLVDLDGTYEGEKFKYIGKIMTGVSLKAEVQDKSIATISPKEQKSDDLPGDLFKTYSFERYRGVGEVTFTLTAKKAGITNLYITAKVPPKWSGGRDKYFGYGGMPVGGPIKVVNCKYRVTTTYEGKYTNGPLHHWVVSRLDGEIKVQEGDDTALSGTGTFNAVAGLFLASSGCTLSDVISLQSPATITAHITGNNQLELTFTSQAQPVPWTQTCPYVTIPGNETFDASLTIPKQVTLSSSGETRTYPWKYEIFSGTATISVMPVAVSAP